MVKLLIIAGMTIAAIVGFMWGAEWTGDAQAQTTVLDGVTLRNVNFEGTHALNSSQFTGLATFGDPDLDGTCEHWSCRSRITFRNLDVDGIFEQVDQLGMKSGWNFENQGNFTNGFVVTNSSTLQAADAEVKLWGYPPAIDTPTQNSAAIQWRASYLNGMGVPQSQSILCATVSKAAKASAYELQCWAQDYETRQPILTLGSRGQLWSPSIAALEARIAALETEVKSCPANSN